MAATVDLLYSALCTDSSHKSPIGRPSIASFLIFIEPGVRNHLERVSFFPFLVFFTIKPMNIFKLHDQILDARTFINLYLFNFHGHFLKSVHPLLNLFVV